MDNRFQRTILTLYNHSVLTPELLDDIVGHYDQEEKNIGHALLYAQDGSDFFQVVIRVVDPEYDLSPDEHEEHDYVDYVDRLYYKWREICDERWGWR